MNDRDRDIRRYVELRERHEAERDAADDAAYRELMTHLIGIVNERIAAVRGKREREVSV
jgi:hypothetical protein